MPVNFRYHPDRDLLIHVGRGDVTLEEIEAMRRERRAAGVPSTVGHTLTDMRKARFAFDPADLRENETGRSTDQYGGVKHAELASDPRHTAMLLLWKQWLPPGVEVEIFSTSQAAYEWLGVEEEEGDLDI